MRVRTLKEPLKYRLDTSSPPTPLQAATDRSNCRTVGQSNEGPDLRQAQGGFHTPGHMHLRREREELSFPGTTLTFALWIGPSA
jgi:hypothetical protein